VVAVSNDVAFTSVPSHPDVGEENPALSYYSRGLSGIIQITVTYARLAGWGGSRGEGRLAPGRRVAGGGVRGHGPPLPLAYKAAPQSSILRTENEIFSLWKSSRFYRPGGTFSLSSALCISGTAALRTNLSSANGGRGEAWANACKLSIELGRVVVWRFHENASVGHV